MANLPCHFVKHIKKFRKTGAQISRLTTDTGKKGRDVQSHMSQSRIRCISVLHLDFVSEKSATRYLEHSSLRYYFELWCALPGIRTFYM